MEAYMDENKCNLSKKESRNENGSCSCSSNSRRRNRKTRRRGGEPLLKKSKVGRRSFTSRCASLVKEQRARFYIMRRCVIMLICWREYQDW